MNCIYQSMNYSFLGEFCNRIEIFEVKLLSKIGIKAFYKNGDILWLWETFFSIFLKWINFVIVLSLHIVSDVSFSPVSLLLIGLNYYVNYDISFYNFIWENANCFAWDYD